MYDCPNCGGNLRFDIPLQQLHCDFCGTSMDPYAYEKSKDAVEEEVFETTVYTCPQCGGEVMTTNVSATGFCMYCGASTILDSRIRNEKRPARIIPFQKTKEDCKKSFAAMMRRSLYAPKELKSPDYLEKFQGIYMPYWMYDFRVHGIRGMHGSTSSRKGDYIITKHYSLSCDMDTAYKGVSFDASSSLDDCLSESIAPFDPAAAKDFTPSFLCGFYADTADVPADTYSEDALLLIADDITDRAKKQVFPGSGAEKPADPEKVLLYSRAEPACAMFPVWFLTYRHRDRVAYAVMNGQTGKISTDLPIVEWKYLAGSLLFAVPLFFLFNTFLTVTAPTALLLTMIPAAASGFAYLSEIRAQMSLEEHEGDKGYKTVFSPEEGAMSSSPDRADSPENSAGSSFGSSPESSPDGAMGTGSGSFPAPGPQGLTAGSTSDSSSVKAVSVKKDKGAKKKHTKSFGEKLKENITTLAFVAIIAISCLMTEFSASLSGILKLVLTFLPLLFGVMLALSGSKLQKEHGPEKAAVFPGVLGALAALAVGELVTLLHPVSDLYYYGAGIASILCTGLTLIAVVRRYNVMATRPLPSFFDRKGGDVRG